MVYEIELKAWVDNYHAVKQALDAHAQFEFQYVKKDTYWFAQPNHAAALPKSGVRIRKETIIDKLGQKQLMLVTYKTKETRGDIEVNAEHEFAVSGETPETAAESFQLLLQTLGLESAYTKEKSGLSYRSGEITAELSTVGTLGNFIELEILARQDDQLTVTTARQALLDFLRCIGIGEEKIEIRYYSELLGQTI